jgi:WD40 repeat protein
MSLSQRKFIATVIVILGISVWAGSLRWPRVRVIDPQVVLRGHRYAIHTLAFAPDGKTVASGGGLRDQLAELKLWDIDTGMERASLRGHTALIESVVFSPDGKTLASSGSDGTVRLRDADSLRERAALHAHNQEALFLAFSPDGKTLASAGRDQTVRFWDHARGQEQASFTQPSGWWILSLSFARDEPAILMAQGTSPNMLLWDLRRAEAIAKFNKPSVIDGDFACCLVTLALSPDGKALAGGSTDGSVWQWDPSGKLRQVWRAHSDMVTSVCFSPRGNDLATGGSDGVVKLWETASAKQIVVLNGHTAPVSALAFSHDGSRLASASNDKTVAVWKLP